MNMWKKVKSILNTKIPGTIWAPLLTGALLGTTMVLFTRLPIAPTTVRTSEENIFGKNESLELHLKLETGEELHLRVTGETTTDLLQNLQMMLENMDENLLLEKYSPSTKHLDV